MLSSDSQYWIRSLPEMSALLPTDTNEDSPRSSLRGVVDDGQAERAALREKSDPPAWGIQRAEDRVEPHVWSRVEDAEAVGPDQPHAALAADPEQLVLSRSALVAGLGEAGGDHDQRLYALFRALPRRTDDSGRRYRHDRQLDVAGHVPHRLEGAHRLHDVGVWVDRDAPGR